MHAASYEMVLAVSMPTPFSVCFLRLFLSFSLMLLQKSGDFDYLSLGQDSPSRINARRTYPSDFLSVIDGFLAPSHPVFAVLGNHEVMSGMAFEAREGFEEEQTYAQLLLKRMKRLHQEEKCKGHFGGDTVCSIGGETSSHGVSQPSALLFASNVAVTDFGNEAQRQVQRQSHADSARSAFQHYGLHSRWRICQWHVNAEMLTTGAVPRSSADNPGTAIYDECLQAGAIVTTGHDHSYARSKSLRRVWPHGAVESLSGPPFYYPPSSSRLELIVLSERSGLVFVNGLGGHDMRGPYAEKEKANHWAKLVNAGVGGHKGSSPWDAAALVCEFGTFPHAPSGDDKGSTPSLLSRDEFVSLYSLSSSVSELLVDFPAQIGVCRLLTAEQPKGRTLDEFLLLSIVHVAQGQEATVDAIREAEQQEQPHLEEATQEVLPAAVASSDIVTPSVSVMEELSLAETPAVVLPTLTAANLSVSSTVIWFAAVLLLLAVLGVILRRGRQQKPISRSHRV